MTVAVAVGGALLLVIAGLIAFNLRVLLRAEALVPRAGRVVTIDGVNLHYIDVGEGPVVFMLHGLGSQLQTFTYALTRMLEHRYRLIVIDRPGAGYSQPSASATLKAQAALFSAFLGALDVERALVVGHSLGGALALAFAIDHPEKVAGLALLAPATQPLPAPPAPLRALAIRSDLLRWIIGWTIAAPVALFGRRRTLTTLFAPDPVPPDFAIRGGSILATRPATYRNTSRDLVEAGGELAVYAKRYDTLRMPVGVLFGQGDRILDYRVHGETLSRQIAGLHLELIADGGHMTPISSPAQSAALIDAVAARAGLASASNLA